MIPEGVTGFVNPKVPKGVSSKVPEGVAPKIPKGVIDSIIRQAQFQATRIILAQPYKLIDNDHKM